MNLSRNNEKLLKELVAKIELPASAYEKSVNRYEDLGSWLGREDSTCADNDPHVFPQGSFILGTAIRPLHEEEEYDLDLACCLKSGITNQSHSQQELKRLIGHELELYRKARNIQNSLDEKHRCWRLEYQDNMSFHMDIVPCIPKSEAEKQKLSASLESFGSLNEDLRADVSSLAVGITDDRESQYKTKPSNWLISNPEGYAKWFDFRKQLYLKERQHFVLESAQVDPVPNESEKTPLQQVIQILKRHRDSMFQDNTDSKPISVIITTLVADGYKGTGTLVDTLKDALKTLADFRELGSNFVLNPVNPEENFADKWDDPQYAHLELEQNFRDWVTSANQDFSFYFNSDSPILIADSLNEKFNLNISEESIKEALGISSQQQSPAVITAPSVKPWLKKRG